MSAQVERYINLNVSLKELNKKLKDIRLELKELEPSIKRYMEEIEADSVSFKGTSIVLYSKVTKKKANEKQVKKILKDKLDSETSQGLIDAIHESVEELTHDKLKIVKS